MTFPISGSQVNGPRGVHANDSPSGSTTYNPPLPNLPPPSPNAASAREVGAALDATSRRVGAMISSSSSPEAIMRLLTEVTRGNESDQLGQIAQRSSDRQEANRAQQAAIQQAIEEQNSSSFWGDFAKVFSYIGAGLAIAGSIVALPFSGGASVLGGVCAVTALLASTASLSLQVASDLGANIPWEVTLTFACIGIAAGGVGCFTKMGAELASQATKVLKVVTGALGSVTQGTSAIAGGASAFHAADAMEHRADATQAEALGRDAQYTITSLIDVLSQNESTRQRFVKRALSMEANRHETAMQMIRA